MKLDKVRQELGSICGAENVSRRIIAVPSSARNFCRYHKSPRTLLQQGMRADRLIAYKFPALTLTE